MTKYKKKSIYDWIAEGKHNNSFSQIEAILEKQLETLRKKGADYNGGSADVLVLFKSVGFEMNDIFLNPNVKNSTKVLLLMIKLKLARIDSLLSNSQEPNFESLQDSGLDLANYVLFLNLDMQ